MREEECLDLAARLRQQFWPMLQGHATLREAFGLTNQRIVQLAGMANDLARQGKLLDAAVLLGGLTLVDPDNALLHSCLGAALLKLKRPESAISELGLAVDLNPSDVTAHVSLGELACQFGEIDTAVQHLEKAVLLDPSGRDPSANRARALLVLISNTARDLQDLGPNATDEIKRQLRSLPYNQ